MNLPLALLLAAHLVVAPRTTLISRVVAGNQVQLVYDLASGEYPTIDAPGGSANAVLEQDAQGWRGRVLARLPLCGGALVVDGATVAQQRCTWVPVVAKE
jgi:hypothetical protein